MIRRSLDFYRSLMQRADVLVIDFDTRKSRLVRADKVDAVRCGILALSPYAIFLLECGLAWEALQIRRAAL